MNKPSRRGLALTAALGACGLLALQGHLLGQQSQQGDGFRFRSGVELINVTATVTDRSGRFVSGLKKEDFRILEDNAPQEISHFSSERVPVSLGIVVDTSGSMAGDKMQSARSALERFVFELLDEQDEIFVFGFSDVPRLLQNWTKDRNRLSGTMRGLVARGGTAMYDAVAEAVPLAQEGEYRKKAIVLISDGNDTNSGVSAREVKQIIRESEVMVYAIGIDGQAEPTITRMPRNPIPIPWPIPGQGNPRSPWPRQPRQPGNPGGGSVQWNTGDRLNVGALRDLTDESGGRTEIIRDGSDLDPATASIADELSQQYSLGYASTGTKDGRWHTIQVEVKGQVYTVRARKGYLAT